MNQKPYINHDYKYFKRAPSRGGRKSTLLSSRNSSILLICAVILGIAAAVFARPHDPADGEGGHSTQQNTSIQLNTQLADPQATQTTTPPSPQALPLPDSDNTTHHAIPRAVSARDWQTLTVRSGDSLATVLARAGLSSQDVHELVSIDKHTKKLSELFPGDTFKIKLNEQGKLEALSYELDETSKLEVTRKNDVLNTSLIELPLERRLGYAHGTIESSLFLSAQNAGLPDKTTLELAEIFGWDIDFALDIRDGDSFAVLFEEFYRDGKQLRIGNIVAAEFTNNNKTYKAIRFEDDFGVRYYSPEGNTMRKAFLRTPVEFSRISSKFNTSRKHPVLNTIRAHKGVDYAAPTGTPIRATGDGKVVFKGDRGGYGRTIILQHANKYSTLYAHMSRYASRINNGTRVQQGQIIGYIGASGLATGPHLHYEFRIDNIHRDPLKVQFPKSLPLEKKYLTKFNKQADELLATMNSYKQTQVALGEQ